MPPGRALVNSPTCRVACGVHKSPAMAARQVDSIVLIGLALLAGGLACACPWPTALAAAITLLLVRRHARRWAIALSVAALLVSALRARHEVREFDRERAEIRASLGGPSRCAATAIVASSPVFMHGAAGSGPFSTPRHGAGPWFIRAPPQPRIRTERSAATVSR